MFDENTFFGEDLVTKYDKTNNFKCAYLWGSEAVAKTYAKNSKVVKVEINYFIGEK